MSPAPSVLIVERDAALRARCGEYLRDAGYRVVLAQDDAQALRRLAGDAAPQSVVLATAGRAMAGQTLFQHLVTECPATAVVLRQSGAGLWADFATWGADGCVGALADLAQLEHAIDAALRSKRAQCRLPSAGKRNAGTGENRY